MPFDKETELNNTVSIGLLLVICILCLALFADKAFHMDDPLFIYAAKHIQTNPFDFYGFTINWYGFEMPMSEVTKNPPLAAYYMALAALLFGWSEIALHLAFLIPASAVVIGTFFLAKELCDRPFFAALAGLATPVFLLSSTTVMCDTLMLSLWVWAIYFWRRGIKRDSNASLALAAFLIAACGLTKYFGMSLIPLLFVYSLAEKRKAGGWMLFLLVPILILAAYQWATQALYGRGLLLDAASYSTSAHGPYGGNFLTKVLVGVAFTGGCFITTFLYAPLSWRKRTVAVTALFLFVLMLIVQRDKTDFNFPVTNSESINWLFLIQFSLFLCSGVFFLSLVALDFKIGRDADSLLLFLWTTGTFIFASYLNWSMNGRSILPVVPASGILLARRIGRLKMTGGDKKIGRFLLLLAPALIISLAVTWADYRLANTARSAALEIHDAFKSAPGSLWFQGHWGFQYYMERAGSKAMDFNRSEIQIGDIVVMPLNNTNTRPLPRDLVLFIHEFQFEAGGFLTDMNEKAGAGFYATDARGPLPFAIGFDTVEKYGAFQILR
jgi:4-amino-4-deoxy-L-arabinose transferase-like glycosyltransferase